MDTQIMWEYTTASISSMEAMKDLLNLYGEMGWELVQIDGNKAYFKRRVLKNE